MLHPGETPTTSCSSLAARASSISSRRSSTCSRRAERPRARAPWRSIAPRLLFRERSTTARATTAIADREALPLAAGIDWPGERGALTAHAVRRFAIDEREGQGLGRETFFLAVRSRRQRGYARRSAPRRASGRIRRAGRKIRRREPPPGLAGRGQPRERLHDSLPARPIRPRRGWRAAAPRPRAAGGPRAHCRSGSAAPAACGSREARLHRPGVTMRPGDHAAGFIYPA